MAPRRKPTKAEQKAKLAKRTGGSAPAVSYKNPSFEEIKRQAGDRKIVLHLGCRSKERSNLHKVFQGDDWAELRLDINPELKPHIIGDMRDLSMFPDNSVDAVWVCHAVEQMHLADIVKTFREIQRVLISGGQFLMATPDLQTIANFIAHGRLMEPIYDSPAGPIAPIDLLYGFRPSLERDNLAPKRCGFTAESLIELLRDNGFNNIRIDRQWVEMRLAAVKFLPEDARRSHRIETHVSKQIQDLEMPQPIPLNRAQHPGQFAPNMMPDELDIPPKRWKPLGLKKSG